MPNIKSAKKRTRIIKAKTIRNKIYNSSLKTFIKKAKIAIESGAKDKEKITAKAISMIDKTLSKGILHKNTAARKKSKLAKKLLKV